jgi:uncharacterized protein YuzE
MGERPKSAGCREVEPDTLLEVNEEGELIGIEFLSPELVTAEAVNRAVAEHGFDPIDPIHLSPLRDASGESTLKPVELTVTYRNGRPCVGYLRLSERRETSAGSCRVSDEMVIDVDRNGCLIGIEFLSPVSFVDVHLLLLQHGLEPLTESQLKPILIE